jgi:plasmid stabilization system protein ParE
VKVRFTPEAEQQAEESDTWWRQHRPEARDLFAQELRYATDRILSMPDIGTIAAVVQGRPVRRLLMRRTRHHLYYSRIPEQDVLIVHAIWGAPRGVGPPL